MHMEKFLAYPSTVTTSSCYNTANKNFFCPERLVEALYFHHGEI